MTTERRAVLEEAAAGGPRAKGLDALCTLYRHGFAASVRRDVRGRANTIVLLVDTLLRGIVGDSTTAQQLREIKQAAKEIPVLLGDGARLSHGEPPEVR